MSRPISKILEDPIDWQRDQTRAPALASGSIAADVDRRWLLINKIVFDGARVESDIRQVEEALQRRKDAVGTLNPQFDWKHDLELARWKHGWYLEHLDDLKDQRESLIGFWRTFAKDGTDYYRKIAIEGMKLIFLLHGAVALGALGVLTQSKDRPVSQVLLTAKVALVCAAIGIILAGGSQLALVHFGPRMLVTVDAKIIGTPKWTKVRAIGRYFRRFGWINRWAQFGLYASIFWFAIYVLTLLILLISA